MSVEIPTIGRMLHYVSRGSADGVYPPVHVPFLVMEVNSLDETNGTVSAISNNEGGSYLFDVVVSGWTFNPNGLRYEEDVPFIRDIAHPATCHWPERV